MTMFPRTPRLVRGALVSIDLVTLVPQVILFQYNPETLTRSLQPRGRAEGEQGEVPRVAMAPTESIRIDMLLDASDQLERGATGAQAGLHPQLAALELLLYPPAARIIAETALLAAGTIELMPPAAPLTLFIYGARRVLPVQLTELSITEEAHDPLLAPLLARASIGLRVLSYSDLPPGHPGYALFLAHQTVKETLAALAVNGDLGAVAGGPLGLH